jgi:hypothetical protein
MYRVLGSIPTKKERKGEGEREKNKRKKEKKTPGFKIELDASFWHPCKLVLKMCTFGLSASWLP